MPYALINKENLVLSVGETKEMAIEKYVVFLESNGFVMPPYRIKARIIDALQMGICRLEPCSKESAQEIAEHDNFPFWQERT